MSEVLVNINGEMIRKSEAKINCYDEGVTHGWAVYEGIRVYDGCILELDAHIERLYDSAKGAFIQIPISKKDFKKEIIKTVTINGIKDVHLMPWVSYGEKGGVPTFVIRIRPLGSKMGLKAKAIVSSIRRTSCDSIDAKIKTNSRLDLMLASVEASNNGVDYAIMLDNTGLVAEASMANIMIVKNCAVYTPYTVNALDGITRQILMKLLSSENLHVEEKNLTIQDMYSADEIFVCGTGAEIRSIIEVDSRIIGEGKTGPITMKAVKLYKKYIMDNGEKLL
jgi:branched-chain amino acid aminotransferase